MKFCIKPECRTDHEDAVTEFQRTEKPQAYDVVLVVFASIIFAVALCYGVNYMAENMVKFNKEIHKSLR